MPVAFFGVASGCGGIPVPAARTGHAVSIEPRGDLDGRGANGKFCEDAFDDGGLCLVDLEQSANEFAVVVKPDTRL